MKNYVQPGHRLPLTAPYDVASGAAFKVGSIIAVASFAALSGAAVEGQVEGVFDLAKATGETWAVGDLVYWDDSAKKFTKTTTSNTKAGVATATAASGDTVGRLRLNGSF